MMRNLTVIAAVLLSTFFAACGGGGSGAALSPLPQVASTPSSANINNSGQQVIPLDTPTSAPVATPAPVNIVITVPTCQPGQLIAYVGGNRYNDPGPTYKAGQSFELGFDTTCNYKRGDVITITTDNSGVITNPPAIPTLAEAMQTGITRITIADQTSGASAVVTINVQ